MGNEFDERYDIRIANVNDIENIMEFIDKYWKKGHIMAVNRSFFEYEFCDGDRVNFIIAVDKKTNEIECVQGFIPTSSLKDPEKRDFWGSIWKLNDTHENIPLLGLEVDERMQSMLNARMCISSGLNPNTSLKLARRIFKKKTGKMNHYYILGKLGDYKIAKVINFPEFNKYITCPKDIEVMQYQTMSDLKIDFDIDSIDAFPYKDAWYVEKRYFNHPVYHYLVYGIKDNNKTKTVLVMREISCRDRMIIRVVDCIGDHSYISFLGEFFEKLVRKNQCEYLDFYEYGVDDHYFTDAGLKLKDNDDPNIIPNYFEPFVQENIDVWVSYDFDGTTFFKADADQDRPSIV